MKRTSPAVLIALGGFCAAASYIVVSGFYGAMATVPIAPGLLLIALAVLCLALVWKFKNTDLGLDRTQLNPIAAANFLIVGKASAYTGAIFGGIYLGMAVYVLPKTATLLAAVADTPGVVTALIGGIALSAAGFWLERTLSVPPPDAT
ncbi:putative secreted protein [Corynebacterium kutscheri]|uniref:Secreted protein n=1 Tax=Corynebacterium kutscheri TaxID=35755 RepID=A0A0F6QYR4_9CORY|nr:DUF3180 domain-containing protein [Corynebacterium kutscheri]AKE40742.1 Protein of unknown function (DUF3180) [Corynebacterium kutscheri]VEH04592.1 putative secreted protein [Corynebacterium kutscheri]VEH11140.1 putative secreted protein [Corynebacterium kutscheri]VEH80383.1 putative secreted protein [Corynebacterium kutscheri]